MTRSCSYRLMRDRKSATGRSAHRRHERLLSMHDVLFEQFDGLADVSGAAGIEDSPMVAVGLLLAGRHRDLQPDEAANMAVVRFNHRQKLRPVAWHVQRFVEPPVHLAPLLGL